MKKSYYFSIYHHNLLIDDNTLIVRKFIVLKNKQHQICAFTDFHNYVIPKKQLARSIHYNGGARFDFIIKFLNYVFWEKYHIESLDMISVSIVRDFLIYFGLCSLQNDTKKLTKATVEQCITATLDFINALIEDKNLQLNITKEDLYKTIFVRNKQGKMIKKKVPVFDVTYLSKPKDIFRDMPNKVFEIFLNHFMNEHPELLMLVTLSAFAGLRPSESCNVRREDSNLGPGIQFTFLEGELFKITIDLTETLNLRSDLLPVGGIKKHRTQYVPEIIKSAFYECYLHYMNYINEKKYEADYGPLSLNKQGKAITYDSYYGKFRNIVRNEIIPILLSDENPEVVYYGHLLLENNISPHIFRHWYSVQLVLNGYSIHELMHARGDSSPTSALVYLQNKGEIEKQYRLVNTEIFNYMNWLAEKEYK